MTEAPTFAQVDGSRVRILDAPIMPPGTCALCGASRNDDRKYIDLGLDVDYVGVMYFCTFCMTELVNRIGCLMPDQVKKLQDELDSARQTILDFQSQKAAVDGVISTLRGTGLFSGTDLSSITHPESNPKSEQESVQDVVPAQSESVRISKSTKQSNSEQGPASIPEFGDDDFGFKL